MSNKDKSSTRDSKGRRLRTGERQREDGRYEYRYQNNSGKTLSIYSWRLVPTDLLPKGKRGGLSLREQEDAIQKDRLDGLVISAKSKWTLNQYFDEYIDSKKKLRDSTKANYIYMYDKYVRSDLGQRKIIDIYERHITKFYAHLLDDLDFKPTSMHNVHTFLHPTFTRAVRDRVIRVNPTEGAMVEIREDYDFERPHRIALTFEQQNAFVDFVSSNKQFSHWMPLFTVMLGTGCRIGEITGLRWNDIDYTTNCITIDHQVIYRQGIGGGNCRFRYIPMPKTDSGNRVIPMLKDVRQAFIEEEQYQSKHGKNKMVVDGYSGFIFRNRYCDCLSAHCINRALERIVSTYNAQENAKAKEEKRAPILLPKITCHNFRHTFATRLFENDVALKVMQDVLGHADYQTTMDVYTDLMEPKKRAAIESVEGKFRIS